MRWISLFCVLTIFNIVPTSYVYSTNEVVNKKVNNACFTNTSNDSLFAFNNQYINDFTLKPKALVLCSKFLLNNLNLSNKFTFVSVYGNLVWNTCLQYNYEFTTNIPNTQQTNLINLNHLLYSNLYSNNQIVFNDLYNVQALINNFANNFLSNSYVNLPTMLVVNCMNYPSGIIDAVVNTTNYPYINPKLTFSKYEQEKLFLAQNITNQINSLCNLNLNEQRNNLFCSLNLNNINKTWNINDIVYPINRYLVDVSNEIGNTPQYSNKTTITLNVSLQNVINHYYAFNLNKILSLLTPSYLNNNAPYTSYPNVELTVNNNVVNCLFQGNMVALICNLLLNTFSNNQALINDINYFWNNHLFTNSFISQLFSLLGNNYAYNPQINNLTWSFSVNDAINLINLFNAYKSNSNKSKWFNELQQLTGSNYTYSFKLIINLYQTLLLTYQNLSFKLYWNNNQTISNINNIDATVNLKNINPVNIIKPYKYEYDISKINAIYFNQDINLDLNEISTNNRLFLNNNLQFSCLIYPSYQELQVDNTFVLKYQNTNYLLIQKPSSILSLWLTYLSDIYNLSKQNIQIQYLNWTKNSSLNLLNKLQQSFFVICFYTTLFDLLNLPTDIISYLNLNNYSNNIFNQTNSLLIQIKTTIFKQDVLNVGFNFSSQYYFNNNDILFNNNVINNAIYNLYSLNLAWSKLTVPVTKKPTIKNITNKPNVKPNKISSIPSKKTSNIPLKKDIKPVVNNKITLNKQKNNKWWIYLLVCLLCTFVIVCIIFIFRHVFLKKKQIAKYKQEQLSEEKKKTNE